MSAPGETSTAFVPVSNPLQVDLFFDVTLSMQGFTNTPATSYYQQMIPWLEQAVIASGAGSRIAFAKFGDGIAPLPGREFLNAVRPKFYSDAKYNKKTLIEQVIDQANPAHLTVIVTDLFQANGDMNQLSEKLKRAFIERGLAVGVLGIRSQYRGTVFDVGSDRAAFRYESTTAKPDSGRPFYLLAFGSHANVAYYFATLRGRGVGGFPEQHTLIISRFIAGEPTAFTSAPLNTADKISEISVGNLLAGGYSGERIKAFQIGKGKTAATFSTQWAYRPLENTMVHSAALRAGVTGWKGEDTGTKELTLLENAHAARALHVEAKLLPDGGTFTALEFKVDLQVGELPAAGIYGYRIVLRPANYSLPSWVGQWTMTEEEIRQWHLRPAAFNGAKTFNLTNFLSTLQGAVLSVSPPEAADIYCYVRVDK